MMKLNKVLYAGLALVGMTGMALAAGFTTNGLPTLPLVGTTSNPGSYPQLFGTELGAIDTQLPNGQNPQSVGANVAQIAMAGACMASSTATASAGAATVVGVCGTVTSESLSTAAGANYTLTVTDTQSTATSTIYAAAWTKGSIVGKVQVVSVTPGAGSFVVVVKNTGSVALNGSIVVAFMFAVTP